MTFYEWIMKYHLGTDTNVGSLAGKMYRDRMCPKDGTLKDYERYYRQRNAGESIIQALREAFSLYERDTGGFI